MNKSTCVESKDPGKTLWNPDRAHDSFENAGPCLGGRLPDYVLATNPEVACPTPYSLGPAPGTIHQQAQQESHLPLVGIWNVITTIGKRNEISQKKKKNWKQSYDIIQHSHFCIYM